jgi:hypothetical protein
VYYEIRSIISDQYKVQVFSRWYGDLACLTCGRPNKHSPDSFLNADKLARRVSSTTTTTQHRISALSPIPYYNSSWLHEYAPPLVRPPSTEANHHDPQPLSRNKASRFKVAVDENAPTSRVKPAAVVAPNSTIARLTAKAAAATVSSAARSALGEIRNVSKKVYDIILYYLRIF